MQLRGKVVLITGAASGIGAETARVLADREAELILVDVDAPALRQLASELGAVDVVADVCDLDAMHSAVAVGIDRFGGIDLVLANAGIASYGSIRSVDPATFARVIDVNLLGVFHTVRAALPTVVDRKGYMLLVSSLGAYAPMPGSAGYNASKAGVEQFANTLRVEVAHLGVDVGSAHMGWVDTPLVRDIKSDMDAFPEFLASIPRPFGNTISVHDCVDGIVKGLAGRRRRVNVPGWVRPVGWFRTVVTSRLGDRGILPHVPDFLRKMDEQVAVLGRSTSSRNKIEGDR